MAAVKKGALYMVFSEEVKERIFAELEHRHMSKEEFADIVGCHWQTVYRWAQGGSISLDMADRALKALDIGITLGKQNQKGRYK